MHHWFINENRVDFNWLMKRKKNFQSLEIHIHAANHKIMNICMLKDLKKIQFINMHQKWNGNHASLWILAQLNCKAW